MTPELAGASSLGPLEGVEVSFDACAPDSWVNSASNALFCCRSGEGIPSENGDDLCSVATVDTALRRLTDLGEVEFSVCCPSCRDGGDPEALESTFQVGRGFA
mgnify:CR=1 FL=1